MKKALLFAILALSINAFAQSNHPTFRSNENVRDGMHNTAMVISNPNSEMNLGKIIKLQPLIPQDLIQIFDSVYQWQWDTISVGWIIGYKIINIVYDGKHNMTSYIVQSWIGSTWDNFSKYIYTYNANNYEISESRQHSNGSTWVNDYQYTFIYDANNNRTSYLYQNWNGSDWVNSAKYTYTYDSNNNRITELDQSWNGSDWVNSAKYTYTYDSNDNRITELDQSWNGSDWVNAYQYTYTYDTKNNLTKELIQSWYGSAWEITVQCTYTYDVNNNLIYKLSQIWYGSNWRNSYQVTYTYDANNNQTSQLYQSWYGSNWVNSSQLTYTYDANSFEKSYSSIQWNNTGTKVTAGDSAYLYYHTILGINDLMVQNGNLTIYPNPTSTAINIKTTTKGSLTILNTSGQQILQQTITKPNTTIDVSGLKSGVYFVRLTGEKKVLAGKFVKS